MSLRFVFGGSGAGKSTRIYGEILKRAEAEPERNFLVIVPDQFTMQTQKELVTHPLNRRRGILNVDVLSFGRLSHRIFEETGRTEKTVLDDTGKSLILRKVAAGLQDRLPYLGAHLDKQGYIHEIKSAISEFMQYGIRVEQVQTLIEYAQGKGALYYKLRDLQVLYGSFCDYIREKYVTTEETLEQLADALERSALVRDSVVVFDGFTGFTPIQNRVIQRLMTLAGEVILTITLDLREDPFKQDGEQKLFHLSKKTVSDLCRLAEEAGVKRGEDLYVDYTEQHRFHENPVIAHLERTLFRYPVIPYRGDTEGRIRLAAASTVQEEVRQTGLAIRRLICEEGYEYRDIAVIAGDLEIYAQPVQTQFAGLEIPCFLDRTRGIVLNPLTEYIKSAYEVLLQDFSYESVFRYLRSGLSSLTSCEVDELENYCIRTGVRGRRQWLRPFTHHTGLGENGGEQLLLAEQLRQRFTEELAPLLGKSRGTAAAYVEALYGFLTGSRAAEKLAAYEQRFAQQQDQVRVKEYAQVYRLVMELLEQVVGLLAEEEMTLQEFRDILDAGFSEIEVGAIPQNVDRVLVGDMERTRLKEVKVLFFLGVNDGNIPRSNSKGGMISDIDREYLQKSGLELAPSPRQQMYIQRLYLYLNLTKPSQRLYLSYARMNGEGAALRPAYLLGILQQLFPALTVEYPEQEPLLSQIYTKKAGLSYLAAGLREYAGGAAQEQPLATLYHAYAGQPEYRTLLERLTEAAFFRYQEGALSRSVARALYGQLLYGSVSRLETYAACAYQHFLRYGMQLKEREEFSFEPVDMGNVFHSVLESFSRKLEESGYTWFDFPESFAKDTVREALALCAAQYKETVLYASARNEYAIRRMNRILDRTVLTLQYQLRKGSFRPENYEVSFEKVSALSEVSVALTEEERMKLVGRIDRIDTCESENRLYVKIVDYKSGNRSFDLAALYYGLQLQLVVYMNAALEKERALHPDREVEPAAMLYYHVADPAVEVQTELTPEELDEKLRETLRMKGVVNSGEEVLQRLDGEAETKSDVIPVEYRKDGSLSARSSVMSGEELRLVSGYVDKKLRDFGREILDGRIAAAPYERGTENACTYCAFAGVCGFEAGMPGYQYRKLPSPEQEEIMEAIRKELQ